MSATIPAGRVVVDTVRVILPIAVDDRVARSRMAAMLERALGDDYDVSHRAGQGITVVAQYRRGGGLGDVPAGALSAGAAVALTVERALEGIGKLRRPLARALEAGITGATIRVNGHR